MSSDSTIFPFYKANIHEARPAAIFCRACPLLSVLIITYVVLYGAFKEQYLLLWTVAIFNVGLWLWVVCTALQCIYATLVSMNGLEIGPSNRSAGCIGSPRDESDHEVGTTGGSDFGNSVVHLIVLPNYKEDESMLADTLRALAEAEASKSFWVVLGMETREGQEGVDKANRLKMRFEDGFARIIISEHPDDLVQKHEDGSECPEVPGKASNLKYAIDRGYQECLKQGVHHDRVLLTVADADCIIHPLYFSRVGEEYADLRKKDDHHWTMWQAPQLPYRNYYTSPIVSRVWGYVASTYEFGGLAGTSWGAHHMVFSCYSLPLLLGHNAEAWDGDVIAEDHHAWLKCFYYWLHNAASNRPQNGLSIYQEPMLRIRPVFLPVKSTSVQNDVYWKSWVERWSQARRHAQGVAELSYALLATYDACRTCLWPKGIFNVGLFCRMVQVIVRIWCMHILPICQTICLGVLSVKWFLHHRQIGMCPDKLWFFGDLLDWHEFERFLLCGFAGAWVLTWPVVIPWVLIVVSNTLMMYKTFLRPAALNRYASIWHAEDAKVPEDRGAARIFLMIVFDCIFGMPWILFPYGMVVQLLAWCNVLVFGNRFSYVTASKGVSAKKLSGNYGTIEKPCATFADAAPQKEPITVA